MDLLDRFDLILDEAARQTEESLKTTESEEITSCVFLCPKLENPKASCVENSSKLCDMVFHLQFKDKVVTVLNFTALLIEHSYARHIYNSTEVLKN